MERLQNALEQARASRKDSGKSPKRTPAGDGGNTPSGDGWHALREASIDTERLVKNRVVSQDYAREAAAFDILRTKIVLQMRKNGWRRLAITSATPACGKTTIACNLAMGLSRQSEVRAVIMDLDLRNPCMARMLGLTPPRDITQLLDGDVSLAEQGLRVRDSVGLSLAASATPDPTRYLLGERAEESLTRIETEYAPDLMVFDTAPVLVSDDTRAFLRSVDCAMIVARAERTTTKQIDTCEREVAEQTNVLGVVLNQSRFDDRSDTYGYDYGY